MATDNRSKAVTASSNSSRIKDIRDLSMAKEEEIVVAGEVVAKEIIGEGVKAMGSQEEGDLTNLVEEATTKEEVLEDKLREEEQVLQGSLAINATNRGTGQENARRDLDFNQIKTFSFPPFWSAYEIHRFFWVILTYSRNMLLLCRYYLCELLIFSFRYPKVASLPFSHLNTPLRSIRMHRGRIILSTFSLLHFLLLLTDMSYFPRS